MKIITLLLVFAMPFLATACNQEAASQEPIIQGVVSQDMDVVCKDPRPEVCTMEYVPVCGILSDKSEKTYASACTACSHEEVSGYRKDACK